MQVSPLHDSFFPQNWTPIDLEPLYVKTSFTSVLEHGVPNQRIYPPLISERKHRRNEERLELAEKTKYCPKGFEFLSRNLEKTWVKVALTIVAIAILCWVFPSALATFSFYLLKPLHILNNTAQAIFSKIPLINQLTCTGHPLLQLVAGVSVLVGASIYDPLVGAGAATFLVGNFLSLPLVVEKISVFVLGTIFNPKIFLANGYQGTILGMVFAVTVTVPIFEELIFRSIIPFIYTQAITFLGKTLEYITDTEYTNDIEWVISKTNMIVCSIIFGAVHFQNNHIQSFAQALFCGWSAVRIMHPVKEEIGLSASIGEHMANNSFAMLPLVIASFFTK